MYRVSRPDLVDLILGNYNILNVGQWYWLKRKQIHGNSEIYEENKVVSSRAGNKIIVVQLLR